MSMLKKRFLWFLILLVIAAMQISFFTERSMVSFCEEHDGISEIFVLTKREARVYWRNKLEIKNENN
jgi:hypothetical protein